MVCSTNPRSVTRGSIDMYLIHKKNNMYLATGATQWQPPPMPPTQYGPPPSATGYPTQPTFAHSQPPSIPFYSPQPFAPAPGQGAFPPPPQHDQAPAQQQSTGVMSKLSNMDQKPQ